MTPAEQLAQAEAAFHALLTGRMATVFVDRNGERVEYARASLPQLRAYVDHLRRAQGGRGAPSAWRVTSSKGLTS